MILDVCKTKDIIIGSHLIVKDQVNSVDSSAALFHYRSKNDPEVKLQENAFQGFQLSDFSKTEFEENAFVL